MEPMEGATTVERMLLSRAKQNRIPINGSIELLPLCNMNCEMCYVRLSREEMERKGRLRTAAEWLALGAEMQKEGVLFLLLTGGEPLLYPDFKDVYLGLRKLGMILTLNTNGTLLDEAWADFFAKNKPRRINITLYASDEAGYNNLCHYPGGFEKTVNAVRLLHERGVDVRIGCSVTPENVQQLQEIRQIAQELDVPVILDTYMMPAERERDKPFSQQARLSPEAAAQARLFSVRSEVGEDYFRQYVVQSLDRVDQFDSSDNPEQMSCLAGSCSFAVNWQGNIRPCVTMSEPSVSVFELGFSKAWERMSQLREKLRIPTKCQQCKLRPLCKICVASTAAETGSNDRASEYLCQFTAEYLHLLQEEAERLSHG